MNMSIGGAKIALVEHRNSGMECEAYPSRLAMVLAVINNGALGGGIGYGGDAHKAALSQVRQQVEETLQNIAAREKREAEIDAARAPWIAAATARYIEAGRLDEDEAREAARTLFSLYVSDGDGMPDAAQAADDDMSTWQG